MAWRARKEQSSATGSRRFGEVGVVDESQPSAIAAADVEDIELVIDERVWVRVGSVADEARAAHLVRASLGCRASHRASGSSRRSSPSISAS